jgi:glutaminyl-tRNA synthetase
MAVDILNEGIIMEIHDNIQKDDGVRTPVPNFIRNIIDSDLASGKHTRITTRFPPEPNGYLHIGHAKSICLNFGLARDYGGICHLRFDDTNPSKEETEYVESIMEDVRWLGFDWQEKLFYASDYFDRLYEYAEILINEGKAYVCDLSPEQIREYRGTLTVPGKNSPYRSVKQRRIFCSSEVCGMGSILKDPGL